MSIRLHQPLWLCCFSLILWGITTQSMAQSSQANDGYTTDQPQIKIISSSSEGQWYLVLKAELADQATAWIDWNNNGTFDDGENLNMRDWGGYLIKNRVSSTITVYGKISEITANENKLVEIDLSQAPNLRGLYSNSNPGLKIPALSLMTNLETLDLSNDSLTTLDISANIKLATLKVYNNALQTLDISNNKELTKLACDGNELTELNISECANLKDLSCYNNRLTTLDVSHCSALNSLHCYDNLIESLTLGNHPSLTYLLCYGNKIAEIDLSHCPELDYVSVGFNQISELDISHNAKLVELFIASNKIGISAMDRIVADIPDRSSATERGRIFVIDTKAIPGDKNYCSEQQVQRLSAKGWTIYDYRGGDNDGANHYSGAKPSDFYTTHQPTIVLTTTDDESPWSIWIDAPIIDRDSIWIDWNNDQLYQIGEEISSWNQRFEYPKTSTLITIYGRPSKLYCSGNQLSSLDLSLCPSLKQLSCRDNQLTELDLSNNVALTELFCYNNNLTHIDLSHLTSLVRLDCESNQLSSLSVSENKLLEHLYCHRNQIEQLDLSNNTYLLQMNCSYNKLSELDLSASDYLYKVHLQGNQIGEEAMKELAQSIVDRQGDTEGEIYVIDTKRDATTTENVCTKSAVATLLSKNWRPLDFNAGEEPETKIPYEGSDDTALNHLTPQTPTIDYDRSTHSITIMGAEPFASIILSTTEGYTFPLGTTHSDGSGSVTLPLSLTNNNSILLSIGATTEQLLLSL